MRRSSRVIWKNRPVGEGKIAQKELDRKIRGAELKFSILNSQFSIKVFTTRPDTLARDLYGFGAGAPLISNFKFQISNYDDVEKYIKMHAHKSEMERIEEGREKTGVG